MTWARRARTIEPLAVFAVALVASGAMWGRLWVTSPSTRGICGCGDPSLFQWFLGWPEHALATGHSLVFSRDLFYPHGINLLANTSVLFLGVLLSPVTVLGGPVLTQNVALLLAVPVAACSMDLLLRRVTRSIPVRVVLSFAYGCSPYVVASLAVSHLMTAWVGVLPLIALAAADAVADDARRARRGKVLLTVALVVQFFVSTELLLLTALVAVLAAAVGCVSWLAAGEGTERLVVGARRLAVPLLAAVVLLAGPAAYALWGPRALTGNIWGPQFNPVTGGTSLLDLVRAHVTTAKLSIVTGYDHPVVQLQLLGWGLLGVAAGFTICRWRDHLVRVTAVVTLVCIVLSLSPRTWSLAPWRWLGQLPVLQNVLQFRIVIFALGGSLLIVARGLDGLVRSSRGGAVTGAALLAVAMVPLAIPVFDSLPLRTMSITTPPWWRASPSRAVVLAYPFPSLAIQSPLSWQARDRYGVRLLGGGGPQAQIFRAGADESATSVLDQLSNPLQPMPALTAAVAASVRAMVGRDGVSEVVVPIHLVGPPLATGRPSRVAAVFFTEVLGVAPSIHEDAWVFDVAVALPKSRLLSAASAQACAHRAEADAGSVAACVLGAAP